MNVYILTAERMPDIDGSTEWIILGAFDSMEAAEEYWKNCQTRSKWWDHNIEEFKVHGLAAGTSKETAI